MFLALIEKKLRMQKINTTRKGWLKRCRIITVNAILASILIPVKGLATNGTANIIVLTKTLMKSGSAGIIANVSTPYIRFIMIAKSNKCEMLMGGDIIGA